MDEHEIEQLQLEICQKENELQKLKEKLCLLQNKYIVKETLDNDRLSNAEIARYSRQLILPEIGMTGQKKLKETSVLIVGAGGLGCPAALYLAAAGIGTLGIVDYDEVEVSNLHRQILHQESSIGLSKAKSATLSINQINSKTKCIPYVISLNSQNALELIKKYNIVLDASDNVATRYLLNDACVLAGRPLVSGSALRFEGQLTIYNHEKGPCYRCLFPTPPPPNAVTNCSDGGVLGVVPGVIGCLQALEAIKIGCGLQASYVQKMLLFDGLNGSFKCIKLRPSSPRCEACGVSPVITKLIDYEQFCGVPSSDKEMDIDILPSECRLTCKQYKTILDTEHNHLLIDVRPEVELSICRLSNALNIPIEDIERDNFEHTVRAFLEEKLCEENHLVVVVCRRGNDSQLAVKALQSKFNETPLMFKDIIGGLHSWAREIDKNFPVY